MIPTNQQIKKQIHQLNRRKILPLSDVLSLNAVYNLIASGYAKIIGRLVFITKTGDSAVKLSYSGKIKWLRAKKEKKPKKDKGRPNA